MPWMYDQSIMHVFYGSFPEQGGETYVTWQAALLSCPMMEGPLCGLVGHSNG